MAFRLGMIVGGAVGYVLGTKAGRERYEQLQRTWGSVRQSQPAQQVENQVREAAGKVGQTAYAKANEKAAKLRQRDGSTNTDGSSQTSGQTAETSSTGSRQAGQPSTLPPT